MHKGRLQSQTRNLMVSSSGLLRKYIRRCSWLEHDRIGYDTSHCWSTSKFFSGSLTLCTVSAILFDSMTTIKIQKLYQPIPDVIARKSGCIICAGTAWCKDMKVVGFEMLCNFLKKLCFICL